jgi:hypothetical protein
MKASCSLAAGARWFVEVLRGAMLMRGLYDMLAVYIIQWLLRVPW